MKELWLGRRVEFRWERSDELLGRLGIVSVEDVIRKDKLRWYGNVERMDVEDCVLKCRRAGLRRNESSVWSALSYKEVRYAEGGAVW